MNLTLETERLWLRPPRITDASALFEHYAKHPEVPRYLAWSTHKTSEETQAFLKEKIGRMKEAGHYHFAILPKELGEPVGLLFGHNKGVRIRLGYAIGPAYWNQGFMSEAVQAVMKYLFSIPHIWRIEALCDAENLGSARVMEKAGMQREALMRKYDTTPNHTSGPKDAFLYAKVREEF